MFLKSNILQQRRQILQSTDWTQVPDCPLSAEKKNEWALYRQAWRDITDQEGFPENVVFPVPPGWVDPRTAETS